MFRVTVRDIVLRLLSLTLTEPAFAAVITPLSVRVTAKFALGFLAPGVLCVLDPLPCEKAAAGRSKSAQNNKDLIDNLIRKFLLYSYGVVARM